MTGRFWSIDQEVGAGNIAAPGRFPGLQNSALGTWSRNRGSLLALAGLLMLAGCGGGTSPAPTAGRAPAPPDVSPSASAGSTSLGSPVLFTSDDGYKYELRASAVEKMPTLAGNTFQPHDAPPGRVFLSVIVQVKNLLTDRGEPFAPTGFYLHIPQTSVAAFDGIQCAPGLAPTATCEISTVPNMMYPVAAPIVGNVELPPAGQSSPEFVQLVLAEGGAYGGALAVAESAPVEQLRLFVEKGLPYTDVPPPTAIPLGL